MTETIQRKCDHCGETKHIEEFNWRYKALGIRHNTCRECMKWFNRRYFKGSAHEEHLKNVRERKTVAREVAREYVLNYLATHLSLTVYRFWVFLTRAWTAGRIYILLLLIFLGKINLVLENNSVRLPISFPC